MNNSNVAEVQKSRRDRGLLCGDHHAGTQMALLADDRQERFRELFCFGGSGCQELYPVSSSFLRH